MDSSPAPSFKDKKDIKMGAIALIKGGL